MGGSRLPRYVMLAGLAVVLVSTGAFLADQSDAEFRIEVSYDDEWSIDERRPVANYTIGDLSPDGRKAVVLAIERGGDTFQTGDAPPPDFEYIGDSDTADVGDYMIDYEGRRYHLRTHWAGGGLFPLSSVTVLAPGFVSGGFLLVAGWLGRGSEHRHVLRGCLAVGVAVVGVSLWWALEPWVRGPVPADSPYLTLYLTTAAVSVVAALWLAHTETPES